MGPKQPASVADGPAGEHLRQPRGACEVGYAQGGRLGLRAERLDRHLVQAYGLLVSERCDCAGSGPPGIVDRLLAASSRGRLEEVMCELSEMGIDVRRVEVLEGLADLAVELYPATSRQAVVCGVPNQGMGEAHAPDHARDLGNDARLDPLVEQGEDAVTLESADTRQRIEIELAPEHRRQ